MLHGSPASLTRDTSMSDVLLECLSVCKRLRSGERELLVVDGVELRVERGEFIAIVGPSGSGKSTLLGLMAGLDRPSSGSVRLLDRKLEELDEDALALLRRHAVGFVFQSFQLLENLTARENVLLPLELAGVDGAARRADEVLAQVGLAERAHHYPSQLSGGEQQRVALARAFAPRPVLLLADEPTGNLDGATGRRVLQLLVEMQAREGTTLVMVTHDPAVAALAHRRLEMSDGRLAQAAAPDDASTREAGDQAAGEAAPRAPDTASP